jgi:hypothetical protein
MLVFAVSPSKCGRLASIGSAPIRHVIAWRSITFFRDAEAIFRSHDGRPRWGKLHFLNSDEVAHLYPELPVVQAIRTEMDPNGMFTYDYLARLGLAGNTSAPAC